MKQGPWLGQGPRRKSLSPLGLTRAPTGPNTSTAKYLHSHGDHHRHTARTVGLSSQLIPVKTVQSVHSTVKAAMMGKSCSLSHSVTPGNSLHSESNTIHMCD